MARPAAVQRAVVAHAHGVRALHPALGRVHVGAVLLSAGAKGKRSALPNSRIMIHQPSSGAQGTAADIEIQAKEILHARERLNSILASHTGQTIEQIAEDVDRDRFMSPLEAVEYGLVDEVLQTQAESEKE